MKNKYKLNLCLTISLLFAFLFICGCKDSNSNYNESSLDKTQSSEQENRKITCDIMIKNNQTIVTEQFDREDLWAKYSTIKITTTNGIFDLRNNPTYSGTIFSTDSAKTLSLSIGSAIKGLSIYNAGPDTTLTRLELIR